MSHSQFHSKSLHLYLHGLALETSIWNWQDQPDIAGYVNTTAEDAVDVVKTLRGYSPCLSAERVPETPVNFTSLSSQELVSLLQPRSLPSGVALLLRVSI